MYAIRSYYDTVEVQPGDTVRDVNDEVVAWDEGITVANADGEEVTFDGNPVMMEQMTVDFTMKQRYWSDGEPVTRITSYNVCYTKLLRYGRMAGYSIPSGVLSPEPRAPDAT